MKVIVIGPRGKMGKLITQVAASRDDMKLVAGIAPKGRDYVGMDLGTVAMTGSELGVPVTDDLAGVIDSCDVIIDFSTPNLLSSTAIFTPATAPGRCLRTRQRLLRIRFLAALGFTLLCFGFLQLPSPPVSIVYFIIEQSFYQPSFNHIS